MKLEVIKKFNGKAEGKVLQPGDVVVTTDIDRINALVKGGYCKITSLEEATPAGDAGKVVEFQGEEFGLDEVKTALGTIGAPVAANAGVKGVSNALAKLSEEQAANLVKTLKEEE